MPDRLTDLRLTLAAHIPVSTRETESLARINRYLAELPAPFDEHADPTHLTASAIVIDGAGHTLLHLHRRLGIWLQPGGHIEADEPPHEAALRETYEETGLEARHPGGDPLLLHVDVHPGGRGHLHLDLRYLLEVGRGAQPAPPPGESQEVMWFAYEAARAQADASFADALDRLSGGSGRASP